VQLHLVELLSIGTLVARKELEEFDPQHNRDSYMIVTIDGPAGSGKSTAARGLAARLGFEYLDTGAMYRAVGYALLEKNIPFAKESEVVDYLNHCKFEMSSSGTVWMNGVDITEKIRTPEIAEAASKVAAEPHVRAILVGWQRWIAHDRRMVCEGRDQGSVVFPDALCKFYLDAGIETRASRRRDELKRQGIETSLQEVIEQIAIRDDRDSKRAVAPLTMPEGATVIHTDHMTAQEVLEAMERKVHQCHPG
jgi:cytidylate kinase